MYHKQLTEIVLTRFKDYLKKEGLTSSSDCFNKTKLNVKTNNGNYVEAIVNFEFNDVQKNQIKKNQKKIVDKNFLIKNDEDNFLICHMNVPNEIETPVKKLEDLNQGIKILTKIEKWANQNGVLTQNKLEKYSTYLLKAHLFNSQY